MATHTYGSNGELVQVSAFDQTLMLTLTDIFPNNPTRAKELLQLKKGSPPGKLQKQYNVKDNSSLVRKIFRLYMKSVVWEMVSGNCSYSFPGRSQATMYVGSMKDEVVRDKRSRGLLNEFDMLTTKYKIPCIKYKFSEYSKRQELILYVNKPYYRKLIETANSGKRFSKYPKDINDFLPSIYEQFPYIKEASIDKIIRICSSSVSNNLRRGEEVRIIDKEGEIRFYRPLGKIHDKVMYGVKKRRLTRIKNKDVKSRIS
tara:strand:+ start:862 stop:1635 length:774 start_codon:yes stop_codon:yes gene_type:complete